MQKTLYPINEIFATIQGEATYTGTPSIFIRLQRCDVGCPWCDTKHTWKLDPLNQTDFIQLVEKIEDKNSWSEATTIQIIQYIQAQHLQIKHVVITGGEPAIYDLYPLCMALEKIGKKVQIETSGTEKLRVSVNTWVSLSPKIAMPGGKMVLAECISRANEIKMPIGRMVDIEKLQKFLRENSVADHIPVWLQPLSQSKSATQLCIKQALLNNWRLSLQTHKFINIR